MIRIALVTIIISISLGLVGCNNSETKNDVNEINKITIEEAKEIAFEHANVKSDQVTFIRTDTDIDNGVEIYDIEFYHEDKEYDYEINAADGQILEYDYDVENYSIPNEQGTNGQGTNEQGANEQGTNEQVSEITIGEAKQIALKHANLKSDQVMFERAEIDYDNGVRKYDIEFYYDNKEYDYEINAADGQIMKYDYDAEYNNSLKDEIDKSTVKITIEQAKEIALKHANLTADQVTFGEVELDIDDEVKEYDVEFFYNNTKYNYEIDIITGDVISYDGRIVE